MSIFTNETKLQRVIRVPAQRGARGRARPTLPQRPASRHLRYLPFLALATDLIAILSAEVFAAVGRDLLPFTVSRLDYVPHLAIAAPLVAVGWICVIALLGGYDKSVFGAGTDEFKRVVNASVITAALIGVGCYLLQFELSRGFFSLATLGGPAFVLAGRLALRAAVTRARRRGHLQQRVLVVGTSSHVDEVASVLTRETRLGYDVVGAAVPGFTQDSRTAGGIRVLGPPGSVVQLARDGKADVVLLAGGAVDSAAEMRRTAAELERSAIRVVLAPSITDVSRERIKARPVGGLPLIHVGKPRWAAASARAKRSFDIVGSCLLIVMLSPILMFAALRVRSHDGGPILFRQTRVGHDGSAFNCWKFRTMVTNAEEMLAELHVQQAYEGGLFKMEDDPRVTPPGKWLRRFSVDELPQLANVLKGEMSLVGPRPPLPHEVAQYDDAMARRLRVRPGMTGLWQVSGRSDLAWSEAIRLDLYYVDNWSLFQDLTILARTFGAVFGSRGAY